MTKFLPVHKLSARIKPNSSLVCDLSAMNEAERARYAYLSKDVFANAQNVRPLVRGYSFHLR
ncbi:MAG TPA: hypothetical protein VFE96_00330, partial [Candidatus Bathyarchaeia archaeon]|nr:hypothetical protein [Candidatus Bathyarchaeia archaeon]